MATLVHICCAPCFAYPHKKLREEGREVVGFWYNPNVHPYMEYRAREDAVKKFASLEEVEVVYGDYDLLPYLEASLAAMREDGRRERCQRCYRYRLAETARYAAEHDFDAFTSTLMVSHQQQHAAVKNIGEELSARHEVPFHYEDFRQGWDQGKAIATQYGLYRQKYCGCLFSEWERYRNSL